MKKNRPGPKVKHAGKDPRPLVFRVTPRARRKFLRGIKKLGDPRSDWFEDIIDEKFV